VGRPPIEDVPAVIADVRAIVLDFDGLILDTETCVYEAWRIVWAEHGAVLPWDRWCDRIGTGGDAFDPLDELRVRVAGAIDGDALERRRRALRDERLAPLSSMPGVVERLAEARGAGLGVAVASSSPRPWVAGHLERLGLLGAVDALATEEDVAAVKPAPDLYLHALAGLGVDPHEAVAFEDSPNGVTAARAAGLRCVAVPGPMTRHLRFDHADWCVPSLDRCGLGELLARATAAPAAGGAVWKSGS
jgi:HAD superfamily hydrolase (TIGR01509 family)